MTVKEETQLALLVQTVAGMKTQLDKNTQDTANIKSTLDNLTGSKQALIWVTGLLVSIGLIIIGIIEIVRKS